MKVLFVCSGNKDGKPGTVVLNQALSIEHEKLSVDFFLIKGTGIIGYIKNIFPLAKHIKLTKPQIIHAHYSLSAITATLSLFFSPKTPLVVSLMGSDTRLGMGIGLMVKLCHHSFWQTTILKSESMKANSKLRKVKVIPNGVDLKKIENIEKKLTSTTIEQPRILFAADPLRESKNYGLAESATKLIGKNLRVVYNKSHTKILEELLNTDIVLLTSLWEGSPNIVKEAMACNRPVVATNVGDIEWLFGNEPGHFLTSFDPQDVAEKIQLALEFSRIHKNTCGRKQIVELGLDSENVANQLIEVYKNALKNK